MTHFSPIPAAVGGVLLGVSATLLLMLNGRIAGISGIVGGIYPPREGELGWRASFVAGLLVGGLALLLMFPSTMKLSYAPSLGMAVVAGLFVGVGTQVGNGCTSGHGVCGISRFSVRSIVATVTFISTGALAVVLMRAFGGAR